MGFDNFVGTKGPCCFVVGDELLNFFFRRRISDDGLRLRNPFRHPRYRRNHFRLRDDGAQPAAKSLAVQRGFIGKGNGRRRTTL